MATEIVTKTWCDPCLQTSEYQARREAVFSETVRVGTVTRNLDLCADHRDQIIGELPEILEKFGSTPDDTPARSATPAPAAVINCPICNRPYQHRNSLSAHTLGVHDISLGELEGTKPGKQYPCEEILPSGEQCSFVARGGQGLGAHKRTQHGIMGTSNQARRFREERQGAEGGTEAEPALV